MATSPDWGLGWTVAAYAVSWIVIVGYTRYVHARSRSAHDALLREAARQEARS